MHLKLLLLILFALSFVPYLTTRISVIQDKRVEFVLHSMPARTEKICVANARNFLFDQSIIQFPDLETCLQLNLIQCFRRVTSQIHQNDVLLSVRCSLASQQNGGVDSSKCMSAHFLFLTSDKARDEKIKAELEDRSMWMLSDSGRTVYEFSEDGFLCLPKPGLLIYTESQSLMHEVLSRLDAWWLPTLALPTSLHVWSHATQQSPYWGLEHFNFDTTSDSKPEQDPLRGLRTGSTFDYMSRDFDLRLTHISTIMETGYPNRKPINEFDPGTGERWTMEFPAKYVTRMTFSNARCPNDKVYSIIQNFSSRPDWTR